MKLKSILFILLAMVLSSGMAFSQSEKIKEKATEKVEELNQQITSVDASLALSAEQQAQLNELYVERMYTARKMKRADESEEAIKAFRKENWMSIKAVLSKEQYRARRTAKANARKDNK